MRIAVLTHRKDDLHDFAAGLGLVQDWLDTEAAVLTQAKTETWDLLVVDAILPGLKYTAFVSQLLRINAMINTAVIIDQTETVFHEESEGLGILCAVPAEPVKADGTAVAEKLRNLLGLA
ncbi:hypothetical protein MASR1M90_13300 [Desulfovibrionales bacterium]